jgi:hypothetical protein
MNPVLTVTCTTNGGSGCCSLCTSSPCRMTFSSDVTSIGNYAFQYCTSVTSVKIPTSVTKIGSNAFKSCTSLTSVTIPDSVTYIGIDSHYNIYNHITLLFIR